MEERGEKVTDSAEGEHLRKIENDPSLKPRGVFGPGSTWSESLPQVFTDTLEGNGVNRRVTSIAASEPPCTSPYSMSDAGVMVEELILKKYKNSHLPVVGSSNDMEGTQIRQRSWQYLYHLAGGPRNGRSHGVSMSKDKEPVTLSGVEDVRNGFWVQKPQLFRQSNQDQAEVTEHLMISESNTASNNKLTPRGTPAKFLPASGFSQIFARNSLKEKGVLNRHPEPHHGYDVAVKEQNNKNAACVTRVFSDASLNLRAKTNDLPPNSVASAGGMSHDGISLREWLKLGRRKVNKAESLHIFKQIVELVDWAHSQQVALDVRPSCFVVLPSNQIKYIGSLALRDSSENGKDQDTPYLENQVSRKRYLEQGVHYNNSLSSKNQKLSEDMKFSRQHPLLPVGYGFKRETDKEVDISFGTQDSGFHTSEQKKTNLKHRTQNRCGSPSVSNTARQQLTSPSVQLEEKWYASPEELNDGRHTFSSNVYSLGVFLFELLCFFESSEVHTAAMSNLRHRILPPNFLSENPKEAGFCLWLLHPELSSRPTTREVLHSELIFKSQELSSEDQLSSSFAEDDVELDLLLHFLATLKEQKEKHASKLVEEIGCLEADFKEVEKRHLLRTAEILPGTHKNSKARESFVIKESIGSEMLSRLTSSNMNEARLMQNINQLENAYFSMRSQIELSETDHTARTDRDLLKKVQNENEEWLPSQKATDRLGSFFDGLCKYARYSKFELRATLRNSDLLNSANVICSLSFDRDEDYFAAAGVSKKIKIFEFNALLNDSVDIHYPAVEMPSKSKLSCVCWNNYIKNYLASTDYDGVVQLWDVNTAQGFSQYREHGKRAWSVDFSKVDPTKFASGSDDASVKLWSINEQKCISTIKSIANVCCVQFSAHSTHLLAFGSADYKTYCYDLRFTRIPWCTLAGHGKAVSYVKFLDPETLISASTDNTLKLWDLNKTSADGVSTSACSLTLSGHTNEKNFVGLSVSDGYIACGSETNEVYAYYRSLPMPITSHKFGSIDPITGQETGDDVGQFVASVCWRGKSNMVVAANSIGSIKLLEMV
ncbi:Protein kinase domain [Macleaya cordata]|uniref:Protein kinase domain n=1 Tax=Macleaya cordata TaxID=56857 RepID=A0A200Q7G7_MACCD|nr:Protein kinase domain [Macleaya cordata]